MLEFGTDWFASMSVCPNASLSGGSTTQLEGLKLGLGFRVRGKSGLRGEEGVVENVEVERGW